LAVPRLLRKNGVARRLNLFDQFQNEIETIKQTFDTRSCHWRNGIAVRLAQGSQLLTTITPQSLVPLYAQRRENAVDLIDTPKASAISSPP
jgi:hypothetical protein